MKNFIFGTATSSYQIEGAATQDGRGPSVWDMFSHTPGKVERNENGDVACDHYNRWQEDVGLITDLGVDAYRFSFSWSRLLPEGVGAVNQKGLDFYNNLIDGLLEKGVDPWGTLFHWDLPLTLHEKGGFQNRDIINWFEEYTNLIGTHFGDRIKNFVVVNEPGVFATHGYLRGVHAPGLTDIDAYNAAVHHLNMIMTRGYKVLKDLSPTAQVGSSFAYTVTQPATDSADDKLAAEIAEAYEHGNYLDPLFYGKYPNISADQISPYVKDGDLEQIQGCYDFIGIQHYMPFYARKDESDIFGVHRDFETMKTDLPRSSFGWIIEPEIFNQALNQMKERYDNPPLYITENGMANFDTLENGEINDQKRIQYFEDYISEMLKAREQGVDIRGYFAWSLMDNFEWGAGYSQRFGLVYVDYDNEQARIPKNSYHWYANKIKQLKTGLSQAA